MEQKEVKIKEAVFGNGSFNVIAGPCTIESKESLFAIAKELKSLGVKVLRGGAYKMRTSPHSFRGLGDVAIKYLHDVCEELDMISVSECIDVNKVELMSEFIDVILVGTRNMQNYPLLDRLGKIQNPIILKRGMSSTIEEWLLAAEYIAEAGNENIILCERGIRTFENYTRNTLDLSAVPALKTLCGYPVIVDPSHSTGRRELIKSMTWAAVAAGSDGVMIETSECPDQSMCDAMQTIDLETFATIIKPIASLRGILYGGEEG
jgi:3-deoxy-7-phosphoheptulonate synthase